LHILFLESNYPSVDGNRGGAGTYVQIVGIELIKRGHKVSVIRGSNHYAIENFYIDHGIEVYTQNIKSKILWYISNLPIINNIIFQTLAYFYTGIKIYSLINKINKNSKIDLIEYSSIGDFWQSIFKSIPYCVHLHGSSYTINKFLNKKLNTGERIMNCFVRHFYKNAKVIISPSKWMLSEVEKENKINFTNKVVLKYPIDYFNEKIPENKINSKIKFFMAARDDLAKGWKEVYNAINNLSDDYIDKSEFIFFGLSDKNYFKNKKNVIVHQFSERLVILEELKKSNVALIPSWVDNSPNTVYEAMLYGKAVIASKISGIPELVINKKTGLLINPFNSIDFVKSLEFMIDNPNKIVEYGKNGYNYLYDKAEIKRNVTKRLKFWIS